jgi:hypothetical protein
MLHRRFREVLDRVVPVPRPQRDKQVQALAAAGLEPALQRQFAQQRAQQQRAFLHLRPGHTLPRIEVEHAPV